MTREQVITTLAKSATYGNLGLFVGAGFCKAVLNDCDGGVALSWGELLQKSAAMLKVDYEGIDKTGVSYPEIASSICTIHSVQTAGDFSASLRRLKQAIAELTSWYPSQEQRTTYSTYLEALSPAWVITTNYDLVIESLLTGKSIPLGPNDSLCAPKGIVPVYHLHGVRTNPEEIIIAQEDYVSLFRPTEYRQMKLALTIKESTTLFIGYRLGDVNVLTALDWSRHVFKSEQQTYPNAVVQVVRKDNPSEAPYEDKNGIVILETAQLPKFFEEYAEVRNQVVKREHAQQKDLAKLAEKLNTPDTSTIGAFIDDEGTRATVLKVLSNFPTHLVAGFVSFMDKCIDETWKRSMPNGQFEGYNQNLTILLDILTAFPLSQFPPALFQSVAYGLNRVAYYVGTEAGKSWSAAKTWERRKAELGAEIIAELRSVAKQYQYYQLKDLMSSLP